MALLIFGLAIWSAAHLFGVVAPAARAGLTGKLGEHRAKGMMAGVILSGVVLMVLGYRITDYVALYTPPAWAVHLNNLLMLISVLMFGAAKRANMISHRLRHPMLTGMIVWAVAHLLVNGDLASMILFGGLAVWAVASMALANRRDGAWERPGSGDMKTNVKLVVISAVVYVVIVLIHSFALGYPTFPA
jgi:uncharacterized membrane protein